jgi:hypothetical protein
MKKQSDEIAVRELEVVEYLSKKWKCHIEYTGLNVFSKVDGYVFKDSQLQGLCEIKCRRQGLSWMMDYKSIVISFQKLQLGADLSRLLGVKFLVVIETSDKSLIVFEITDKQGNIVCPMNVRFKELDKNTNFEKKTLTNAYLSLEDNKYCKIYDRRYE